MILDYEARILSVVKHHYRLEKQFLQVRLLIIQNSILSKIFCQI